MENVIELSQTREHRKQFDTRTFKATGHSGFKSARQKLAAG